MTCLGFIVEQAYEGALPSIKLLGANLTAEQQDVDAEEVTDSMYYGVDLNMLGLEFVDMISVQRAMALLQTYQPELIEDIDVRVFSHDGDSAESVMALKGVNLPAISGDSMANRIFPAINAYIQHVVELDTGLPYLLHTNKKGKAAVLDEEDDYVPARIAVQNTWFRAESLELFNFDNPDAHAASPSLALFGVIEGPDTERSLRVALSLESIVALTSLRSRFYR